MLPPLFFCTAGMLYLFGKVQLFCHKNEVSTMYGYKATHLATIGSHIFFFFYNYVKMLAEINEHACIKLTVDSI